MGRYTGPKARINRRLGFMVFENAGAIRAAEKKEYPPGMSQRRRKVSNYGLALTEEQKIKYFYGLREVQLRRYFAIAKRTKGNTSAALMIRRAGFAQTRPQARQGVVHGHFQVNGKTVTRPSYMVRPGDAITLRNRPNLKEIYRERISNKSGEDVSWVSVDTDDMKAVVTTLPTIDDVSLKVDVGSVVAFMSR